MKKNVGYRLTLARHNRRPPSDHPQLRGPRLHLEPQPYIDLTLQIDFDSIENIFLQNIFSFTNFQNFFSKSNL